MRIALFYNALGADHRSGRFIRGCAAEFLARGHEVRLLEPADRHIPPTPADQGDPRLRASPYTPGGLDLDSVLGDADLVIAHEWNDRGLLARLGRYRAAHPACRLLLHDTNHRAAGRHDEPTGCDLSNYDG